MTKEDKQRTHNVHDDKQAHQREILQRIHRLQGQFNALAKLLEASGEITKKATAKTCCCGL